MISPLFRVDKPHFHTNGGSLASGWKLRAFVAGTDVEMPVQLYKDAEGAEKYPTTIILNMRGEPDGAGIFADAEMRYKIRLENSFGNEVYTIDNVGTGTNAFILEGSETINVELVEEENKTTYKIGVKEKSIDESKLKKTRDLIPDGTTLEFKEFGEDYVVIGLKNSIKQYLEQQGVI